MNRGPRAVYGKTILACGLTALATAPGQMGSLLLLLAPFLAGWFLYGLYVICRKPERRKFQAVRMALWTITLISVSGLHAYRANAARRDAQAAVEAVWQYKERHGTFPTRLDEAGIDSAMTKRWWLIYLARPDQPAPSLFYRSTFLAFDAYRYDFESRVWQYVPD